MQVVAMITDRVITTFVYQSEGGEAYVGVGEAEGLMVHRVSEQGRVKGAKDAHRNDDPRLQS